MRNYLSILNFEVHGPLCISWALLRPHRLYPPLVVLAEQTNRAFCTDKTTYTMRLPPNFPVYPESAAASCRPACNTIIIIVSIFKCIIFSPGMISLQFRKISSKQIWVWKAPTANHNLQKESKSCQKLKDPSFQKQKLIDLSFQNHDLNFFGMRLNIVC